MRGRRSEFSFSFELVLGFGLECLERLVVLQMNLEVVVGWMVAVWGSERGQFGTMN